MTSPVLTLYRVPPALLPALRDAANRVWSGVVTTGDEFVAPPTLVAVAGADAAEAFSAARHAEGAARGRVPVLAFVRDGARQARAGRLPGNVTWVLGPDDLDARVLGLAMRYSLEVSARWRLTEQYQAIRPLADLGHVASATSHEIGNPLTSLLMNLEAARGLVAAMPPSEGAAQLGVVVSDALEGARHVARIAQDLSRASRPTGKRTTVDAWALVETARRLGAEFLRGIEVEVARRSPVLVRVDERRLTQVLLNLLRNAAQALATTSGGPRRIRVEVEVGPKDATLRVADNGPGIPPAIAGRLFEPWVTTKAQGSGLGLSLARQYLAEMDGSLQWVPTDRGTCFALKLPLGEAEARRPTLVPEVTLDQARVLVIDDVALVRRSIARALAAIGKVDQAKDGAEALALLAEHRYDVIFLDMNLGSQDGIAVWRQLRREHPEHLGTVVFLSGGFTAKEQEWLDQHDVRWARKPLGLEEVRDLVVQIVAGGS